jgi:hypothetical protein
MTTYFYREAVGEQAEEPAKSDAGELDSESLEVGVDLWYIFSDKFGEH